MGERVNTTLKENSQNKAAGNGRRGNQNAVRHGIYSRVAAMKGHRWDRRTRTYKAVEAKVRAYSKALGTSLSPQKVALLREAAEIEVVLGEPLTAHLASKRIVRRGKVDPAVELRLRLSARLQELLSAVGLERVKRQPKPLWG